MKKHLQHLLLIVAMLLPLATQAQVVVTSTSPFMEDFETTSATVSGWTQINVSGSHSWSMTTGVHSSSACRSAHGGSLNASYIHSSSGSETMLISPVLDLSGLTAATLNFWYVNPSWAGDIDDLAVYFRTDTTASWTFLASYDEGTASWTEAEFTLTSVSSTVQIAFDGYDNWGYGIGIDDVIVSAPPSCIKPANFLLTSATSSDLTFAWTPQGTATSWVLEYDTVAFTLGNGNAVTATDSTYTLTGLQANTLYYVMLYSDCGGGDVSIPLSMTAHTTGEAVSLPISCDFEGESNPFQIINGNFTDTWVVGTAQSNGGTHSMYVSSNGGTTASYATGTAKFIYAVMPFSVTDAGRCALTYDWKANGESTWDYLRAFIVPGSVQIEASANAPNGATSTSSFSTMDVPGWISLGYKHNLSTSWNTETSVFDVTPGNYQLVFLWCNDGGSGSQPPACIDNVVLRQLSCPQPGNVAVSAMPEEATATWTPGGSESTWLVRMGTDEYTTNDTTYTFEDLTPNSNYTFTVYAICGSDDTSLATTASFHTPCSAIATDSLPYNYGFEGIGTSATGAYAPCWYKLTNYTSAYPYGSSTSPHTGTRSLYFYSYNTIYSLAAMPMFEEDINELQVSFWVRRSSTSYSGQVKVGVMTDPSNINTFVEVATVAPSANSTSWEQFDIPLSAYQGQGKHIAFLVQASGTSYNYVYIDDVTVDIIPACPKPVQVTVDNITGSTATLSWVETGSATSWNLHYDTLGVSYDMMQTAIASDTTITLTDLLPNTVYTVYLQADCGGDTSLNVPLTFRTACVAISEFPWSDNFESYTAGQVAPCWDNSGSTTATISSNPSYVWGVYTYAGNKMLRMYNYFVNTGYTQIETPILSIPSDGAYEVSFNFSHLASSPAVTVSAVTADSAVVLGQFSNTSDSYDNANPGTFDEAAYSLAAFAGQDIKIRFSNQADYSSGSIFIDNVKVEASASCDRVAGLVVDYSNGDTVTLSWPDNGASSFQIAYGQTGFNIETVSDDNIVSANDTTITLTGLPLSVTYDFYVRTDCGSEQGPWRGPVSAMTGFFYTMQSGSDTLRNACGYIITDNGGISGSYTANFDGTLVIYPANDNQTLVISGTSYTEGSYDYLTIYDGVGTSGTPLFCDNVSGVSSVIPFGPFTSDEGVFTITFHSDVSGEYDGFKLAVQCVNMSSCTRPNQFALLGVDNESANLSWNERGTATSWQLEYGPTGFTPGDTAGTIVTATTNPFTLTGLAANTSYDVYLQADCGTETSAPTAITFRTACNPVDSLPYFYGFEDATASGTDGEINPCWHKFSSYNSSYPYPYTSAACTGSYGMYFYNYASNGGHCYLAMPLIDEDIANLQVSFKLKRGTTYSYSYYSFDMQVGVMTDPSDINTFTPVEIVTASSSSVWDSITVYLAGYQGNGRYIAFRDNGTSSVYYTYLYLDDITVDLAPECGPVSNLTVNAGVTTALVSWDPSTVGQYNGATVEYKLASATDYTSVSATGNYVALTGLTDGSNYDLRVINNCTDGQGQPVAVSFRTNQFGCLQADTTVTTADTIAGGTSENQYLPSYSFYNYALSEQIYLASELGGLGDITGMKFYSSSAAYDDPTRLFNVYLGHTSETTVANWLNPGDLTLVYTGSVTYVDGGWINLPFTTTFNYNGSDNLLVVVQDATGVYESGNYVRTHALPDGRVSRYSYQDPGLISLPNPAGTVGTTSERMDAIFTGHGCGMSTTCGTPIAMVTNITPYTAELVWAPGNTETSWIVEYKTAADNNWTSLGTLSTTSAQLTNLNQGTNYMARIINPSCIDSLTAFVSFATECAKIDNLPFFENFNGWGAGIIPNCWSNENSYSPYGTINNSFNHSGSNGGSIYTYASSSASSTTYTILPEVDTNIYNINDLQVVFYALNSNPSYAVNYAIGVMTNPNNASTFRPIDTVSVTQLNSWQLFEVPLSNYTNAGDTGAYICIKSCYLGAYGYGYIDDVTLEVIPTCPRPDSLSVSNATTTSVDLSWHERGSASQWIIEYGPRGFQLGTGTQVVANSNPFTLTNLTNSFEGEFYVRSICSSTDSGLYSRLAGAFNTSQIPATIPYVYDFENATEWGNWQTSSNHATTNWYRGTADASDGQYSMYISADNGATVGDGGHTYVLNAAAYRDIDFGTVDSTFTISFKAKIGGTISAAYDGMMVFLVDPASPTIASSSNITSPWGNVNDLYRIATARLDTTWETYTASLDTISGIHRVAFFYFCQNTSTSTFIGGPAEVDSITIDYSTCPRPLALEARPATTTADLSWYGPASAQYEIIYRKSSERVNHFVTCNTNHYRLTGLDSITEYYCWVRKICGNDTSLTCDGISFFTTICDNANVASTGTMDGTSYYAPTNNFYKYTLSEMILDSAEIGGTSDFNYIGYYYNYTSSNDSKTNVDIYLQPTNKTEFSSPTDFVALDTTIAVKVYSGDLICTQGWNFFELDAAYHYNGQGNLLVIVDDNSGAYSSSSHVWGIASCTGYKTIASYSDSYDTDPLNPSASSGANHAYYNWRPAMQLLACGGDPCPAPAIASVSKTYQDVTINWTGSGSNYEVAIRPATSADYSTPVAVQGNTYTFTGLQPATIYYFEVRQDCSVDSNGFSAWVEQPITTDSLPCFAPTNLHMTAATNVTATFAWNNGSTETAWEIHVWRSDYDHVYEVNTNPATITGLTVGTEYSAAIRALCGTAHNIYGEYGDTITFTTAVCDPVTNVNASASGTSITVTWTAGANNCGNFEIDYGFAGAGQGEGLGVIAINNGATSYTFNGLEEETAYRFLVRAVCADGWVSVWSNTATATTGTAGTECGVPTNVTATANGLNVTVTFTAGENNTGNWQIEYGPAGFDHGQGQTVNTTTTTKVIERLSATTEYDFYVRAICSADNYSAWSEVATATTGQGEGIYDVEGNFNCNIFPNPATDETTISVSGVNGQVTIAVVDMNGRTVSSETLDCAADCVKKVNVSNLTQGAYFVRIYGENVNSVKKLIVR